MSIIISQNSNIDVVGKNINPNPLLRTLMVIALVTILLACNLYQSPEMKFDVNHNLLGMYEKNPALKVNYQVPIGFSRLSDTNFPEHYQNIPVQNEEGITIRAIYQDTTTGSWMILSTVDKDRWQEYEEFVDNTTASPLALEWNYVNATAFTYNTFDVQQWLLQDFQWINFKLLFNKNASFFQVDYLIPTLQYDKEVARIIESSIGSFKSN